MNSAVWFGNKSGWTALVKLKGNNKIYAFLSFFVLSLYPIGPAKSRLQGARPFVLSVVALI